MIGSGRQGLFVKLLPAFCGSYTGVFISLTGKLPFNAKTPMEYIQKHVMEPPIGIATFNATLQTFDPLQMMKEAAEEMKQRQQQ